MATIDFTVNTVDTDGSNMHLSYIAPLASVPGPGFPPYDPNTGLSLPSWPLLGDFTIDFTVTANFNNLALTLDTANYTINTASWTGTTNLYTTSTPHSYSLGEIVRVSGVAPDTGYNFTGSAVANVPGPNQFEVAYLSDPGTYSSGGTASYVPNFDCGFLPLLYSATGFVGMMQVLFNRNEGVDSAFAYMMLYEPPSPGGQPTEMYILNLALDFVQKFRIERVGSVISLYYWNANTLAWILPTSIMAPFNPLSIAEASTEPLLLALAGMLSTSTEGRQPQTGSFLLSISDVQHNEVVI
jgi:hypothetical protein